MATARHATQGMLFGTEVVEARVIVTNLSVTNQIAQGTDSSLPHSDSYPSRPDRLLVQAHFACFGCAGGGLSFRVQTTIFISAAHHARQS